MKKISSLYEVLDIFDNFLDDVDEFCGLSYFTYGNDAAEALEFLREFLLKEGKRDCYE